MLQIAIPKKHPTAVMLTNHDSPVVDLCHFHAILQGLYIDYITTNNNLFPSLFT